MNHLEGTVSVIIPAFNCAAFIAEAVLSALQQGESLREVIVIDDGSTDETPMVLRHFDDGIQCVRQQNSGVSAARNHGLRLASGQWVLFLDSDDRLAPGALARLLDIGRNNPTCVVYGERIRIDQLGNEIGASPTKDCRGPVPVAAVASFTGAPFSPGSAIVPRSLALDLGGFDERFSTCADRHFWIRCGALAEFKRCDHVTYEYRAREDSMSKDRVLNGVERVKVQIECLQWCQSRDIQLFEHPPSPKSLLEQSLKSAYWSRRWQLVNALLKMADELGISGEVVDQVRRRHRLGRWLFKLYDLAFSPRRRVRIRGNQRPRTGEADA